MTQDPHHIPTKDTDKTLQAQDRIHHNALNLLTRRDHSRLELKQKLLRKDYDPDDIDFILNRLTESDLLNDHRFAESYIRYRSSRGFGPTRIRMELQTKGVAESIIAELVQITDNAWFADVRNVWHKQFKGRLPADKNERAKQMRFLYNRGFTQEHINSVYRDND